MQHTLEFDWFENNNSCDCNRALQFARAFEQYEDWGQECGDKAYSAQLLDQETGEVLMQDDRWSTVQ